MPFSVAFSLCRARPIQFNYEKKLKTYDKACKFNSMLMQITAMLGHGEL